MMIDDPSCYYVFGAGTPVVPFCYIGVLQVQAEPDRGELARTLRERAAAAMTGLAGGCGGDVALDVFEMQVCSTRHEAEAAMDSLMCYFSSLGINLVSAT